MDFFSGMVEEVNENEMEEANPDSLGQLWEDDDTKSFYESLVDLQEIVPAILYKDSKTQELPKIEESNEELTEIEEDAAAEAEGLFINISFRFDVKIHSRNWSGNGIY